MTLRQSPQNQARIILLVDDDPQILALSQELLEHLGFRVVTAASGDQALELFQRRHQEIDLVIMDLNLPCLDGYQVLNRCKTLAPSVKVIVTSGFFGQDEVERLQAVGVAGIIPKPFRTQQLQEAITQALTA